MKIFSVMLLAVLLLLTSCVYIETKVKPMEVNDLRQIAQFRIEKSVKAHLKDGSVVLYEAGFTALSDTIRTKGVKYDLGRKNTCLVLTIPLSEVAELEYYQKQIAAGPSILGTTGYFFIIFLLAYAAGMSAMSGTA